MKIGLRLRPPQHRSQLILQERALLNAPRIGGVGADLEEDEGEDAGMRFDTSVYSIFAFDLL